MICTKKARDNCEYSRLCGENAEVEDDSECADYIMEMEMECAEVQRTDLLLRGRGAEGVSE